MREPNNYTYSLIYEIPQMSQIGMHWISSSTGGPVISAISICKSQNGRCSPSVTKNDSPSTLILSPAVLVLLLFEPLELATFAPAWNFLRIECHRDKCRYRGVFCTTRDDMIDEIFRSNTITSPVQRRNRMDAVNISFPPSAVGIRISACALLCEKNVGCSG